MQSSWLETAGQGAMISDFIATTVLPSGDAVTAFPLDTAPADTMFVVSTTTIVV